MSRPIAYGIDFGTTNTLLSVAYLDKVDLLTVDGDSELLPTMIYLHRQPLRSAGADAIQQYADTARQRTRCGQCSLVSYTNGEGSSACHDYRPGSGCLDSRLVSEIKRVLADPDRDKTHSWARDFDYPDLVATVFRTLKRRADRALGVDTRRVVVGYPVAFDGAEGDGFVDKQRLAMARLRMAAERAGFTEVELLEEPAAGVLLEAGEGIVLAADFGGGTFDVSIIEMSATEGRVVALAGAAVGGEDLDGLIFENALFPELGLTSDGKRRVPARYRMHFGRRSSALRTLSDADLPVILGELRRYSDLTGLERLQRIVGNGWVHDLYVEVESAKRRLSDDDTTRIWFDRPGVELNVEVTRAEFEGWIGDHLSLIRDALSDALAQAGLQPGDVDVVASTGGSSQLPAFRALLGELFGLDKIHQQDPYSAIALGLGLYARRLWA